MLRQWVSVAITAGTVALVSAQMFGAVTLPKAVMADGKLLPAGTYQVRLSGEALAPAVGQAAGSERWVEFVTNGTTAGRELATVIPASEIDAVANGPAPKVNSGRVDVLKGGEYIRVWINRGSEHYIVHMPPASVTKP